MAKLASPALEGASSMKTLDSAWPVQPAPSSTRSQGSASALLTHFGMAASALVASCRSTSIWTQRHARIALLVSSSIGQNGYAFLVLDIIIKLVYFLLPIFDIYDNSIIDMV